MKDKIFMFLLLGMFMVSFGSAWSEDTFNNSLTSENLTFTGDENITRWLSVSEDTIVTNAFLNLTSGYNITKTVEGTSGNWNISFPASNIYDNDWNTYGLVNPEVGPANYVLINYIKPTGASNNSYWKVKDATGYHNITIPTLCWDSFLNKLEYRININANYGIGGATMWMCWNDYNSRWENALFTTNSYKAYEEEMIWDAGALYTTNSYIQINNTKVWNYTGEFNTTQQTSNLATTINTYISTATAVAGYYLVPFIFHSDTLGILEYVSLIFNSNGFFTESITYNEEVLEFSLEDFILNIKTSEEVISAKMNYNGTDYDSNILSLGSYLYKISSSIQIPDVAVDTNNTFYFNITTPTTTIITESNNQSVYVLLIDNCGVYTNEIFNISLYDEKTLELLLGTIEVNLELFNNDKSTALTTAVSNFYNMNNMRICSNVNLTGTGYFYDLELRYYVDPTNTSTFLYVPEFYHIQKASISNFPQSIDLFNLNVNQSTEFTMYYRDNNYVARENVLLQIERKYISEGIYRTVEIPITSNEGSALGHFDLDNYKYKIIATLNGEILNVFENPAIVCESELSGICTLNLNGQGSANPFEDYDTINDIAYYISFNDTDILVSYVIPSGETRQVNVYMYQVSSFADDKILCNSTLTSSAGTFICSPNATIGDSNVFIEIRIDGVLQPMNKIYFQEDLGDYFNLNNYAIASLFLILFITMMVSSPIIMVASSVFSVVILAFLFLLKGSSIGLVLGSFSWLAIAGILILVKLNKKDET